MKKYQPLGRWNLQLNSKLPKDTFSTTAVSIPNFSTLYIYIFYRYNNYILIFTMLQQINIFPGEPGSDMLKISIKNTGL